MITILIVLLVAAVLLWAARAIIAAFQVPQPIATVIYVIIVLIVLLWILSAAGLHVPGLR